MGFDAHPGPAGTALYAPPPRNEQAPPGSETGTGPKGQHTHGDDNAPAVQTYSCPAAGAAAISYTIIPSVTSTTPLPPARASWPDLCAWILEQPERPRKDTCPLVKLAAFGAVRALKADGAPGSYRHDANVTSATGIEGDYEAESMTPAEALTRLEARG